MISNDIKPYIIRGEMRVNPYSWIVRHNHSNAWWRESTRNMQITIKQKQRYDHVKNTAEILHADIFRPKSVPPYFFPLLSFNFHEISFHP